MKAKYLITLTMLVLIIALSAMQRKGVLALENVPNTTVTIPGKATYYSTFTPTPSAIESPEGVFFPVIRKPAKTMTATVIVCDDYPHNNSEVSLNRAVTLVPEPICPTPITPTPNDK